MSKLPHYLSRAIVPKLKKLFENFPIVVLLGARQIGKSTVLTHSFPQLKRITFEPVQDVQNARKDPDLFLSNNPAPIILDEIQYAPELVPALKTRIDRSKQPGLYFLTGSQQWGVLKQVSESLAGRAVLLDMESFSLAEIAQSIPEKPWLERWLQDPKAFVSEEVSRLSLPRTLYQQLWRGFLPETHFLDETLISDFQSSYQRTYIEKDIRLLADVRDLHQFNRFVRLCAAHTAQEINHSQLGRDINITPQTAGRWLAALEQSFQWFEVPAYANNAVKRISGKPKGYFADTGQVCFSQLISSPEAISVHPLWGSLFETAVVCELRKQSLLISTPPRMYHWRTYHGQECDLILERDGKFFPIEIKANSRPSSTDARGLQAFRQAHPRLNVQPGLIIAPAETSYAVTEQDYVMPWDTY